MESAFARGADDYITKPFAGKELGKIIRAKLEKLRKQTVPG
jgi:DNA-binding response OmpR family regulator